MTSNIKFKGIYSAIFSVYDKNMNVKYDTINKMVNYQLANGLSGFYVGGNTGECTVLPKRTRKQMLEAVVDSNADRGKIICHVGAGQIEEVFDLIDHANTLPIDAIASLPPSLTSYYATSETIEYYRLIAAKSKYPVFAYVTPILKCDIAQFADKIIKIPNIVGIKLTVSDYYEFGNVLSVNGGNINVLNGPDETLLCGLILGAQGAVGTSYNFLPKLACKIYNAVNDNDIKTARENQLQLNKFISLALGHNISYWKAFLGMLDFDMGYTVAPSKMPSNKQLKEFKSKLETTGFFKLI